MKQIIFIYTTLIVSCSSTNFNTTHSIKDCDTIEVSQDNKQIGYIISNNDYIIDKDKALKIINSFETILDKKYLKYYNKFYRQYFFYLNKNGDIILNSLYLNKKETESNPNWKCMYHEIGFYRKKYKKDFPDAFFYNAKTTEISVNSL